MDTRLDFARVCYNPDFEKLKPGFLKEIPEKMKLFSEFLGKRTWFAGDKVRGSALRDRELSFFPGSEFGAQSSFAFLQLNYVDFLAYDVLDVYRIFEPKCLDEFPNLKDFISRFEGLKKISAYMKSSRFLPNPPFSKMAMWGNK